MTQTLSHLTLVVPDISCAHCEATIREEIGQMPGVDQVEPSAASKIVVLEYDPNVVTLEEIRERFSEIEYPVAE